MFKDPSIRYDALRFLAGDSALPDASNTAEVQQYLGDYYNYVACHIEVGIHFCFLSDNFDVLN